MSIYHYPPPRKYRGKLDREFMWRAFEARIRWWILGALVLIMLLNAIWNTPEMYRFRYMLRTGNTNIQIFK